MNKRGRILVWIVLVLTIVNCRAASLVSQVAATATSTEISTPRPTFTTVPTSTAVPTTTLTPVPTVTRSPTRKPVPTVTRKPPTIVPTAVPGIMRLPVHLAESLKPGMRIETKTPLKGQTYCQITHYEFVPNNRAQPESFLWAQDKHWAYFYVRDGQFGEIRMDLSVVVTWAGGKETVQNDLFDTWLRDRAKDSSKNYTWIPNPGRYNGDWDLVQNVHGSYQAYVGGGVVSDVAVGLGVDDGGAPAANVVQWTCYQY